MQECIKKIVGSGIGSSSSASHNHPSSTTLIISNDEIEYITKIVKSLEDSGLLLKGVSDIVQNEAKAFLSILLGTLGACLLRNISADRGKNRAGEGVVRAGYGRRCSKNKKKNGF